MAKKNMKLILKLVFIFIFINNYQIVIAQNGTLDSIKKIH